MYQDRGKATRAKNLHNKSNENSKHLQILSNKKKDIEGKIHVYLGDSPKKKKSLQEHVISK